MNAGVHIGGNPDESIYDRTIGFLTGTADDIVPRDIAARVAGVWKHALTIDGRREDIHYGVCQIYSMGLLTDPLIAYLPTLKRAIKTDDRLCYSMGDYARNIKARGDFPDAMRVYKAIFRLYPDQSGILSDIAGEYYQHGDLDSAVAYVRRLVVGSNCDAMSYGNAFFIFSVTGRYDEALGALKLRSGLSGAKEHILYQGLLQYLRGQVNWQKTVASYAAGPHDSTKGAIADILVSETYRGSSDDYRMLNDVDVDDAWKIVLHRIFKRLSPGDFDPRFNYAEILTHAKAYREAAVEFAAIEKSGLSAARGDSEKVAFYYGWVLWNLGRKEESISRFGRLLASEDFYFKSAAAYFIGRHFLDSGQTDKAKEYFRMVSDGASKSKYATYCWNLLKE